MNIPSYFFCRAKGFKKFISSFFNLRKTNNLNWTYISPACNFVSDGIKTNNYTLGGEELILNANGESEISYADYALALVDEIINNKHNKERISVVSK